uniref:Uncharacterized protein n=1 Tax=Arundo donax TaxID=35708 RepID=A0A0A9CGM2_ARUDO
MAFYDGSLEFRWPHACTEIFLLLSINILYILFLFFFRLVISVFLC